MNTCTQVQGLPLDIVGTMATNLQQEFHELSENRCLYLHSVSVEIGWRLQSVLNTWSGADRVRAYYAQEHEAKVYDVLHETLTKAGSWEAVRQMACATKRPIRTIALQCAVHIYECLSRLNKEDLRMLPGVADFLASHLSIKSVFQNGRASSDDGPLKDTLVD